MTNNPENQPQRLDATLVSRGICPSRSRAQALIKEGVVTVNGTVASKASAQISKADAVALTDNPIPYVSRAALKLVAGLDHFSPPVDGVTALDLGASTGGFCEVLLQQGASKILAIDVGRGQLAKSIAQDPRVTSFEGVNARKLDRVKLPEFQLITADLSFISLKLALPPALDMAPAGCWLIALVKPQFEVGRAFVGKGGIVKDQAIAARVCDDIAKFLTESGWRVQGVIDSPIKGSDGNREFLIGAVKSEAQRTDRAAP